MAELKNSYEDIIYMSHHVSLKYPHRSDHDRAAQFAPFAALTGHGAAIAETARRTVEKLELDESQKEVLDQKLVNIMHNANETTVKIEYFVRDKKKSGGKYEMAESRIRKIDMYRQMIVMEDGTEISVEDVYDINIL